MLILALAANSAEPSPPRNRGVPRLRILNLRESGRPEERWGRVGERGKPQRQSPCGPLSPTLPRKGGGSPPAGASLTDGNFSGRSQDAEEEP